jgi:hypothetical protein
MSNPVPLCQLAMSALRWMHGRIVASIRRDPWTALLLFPLSVRIVAMHTFFYEMGMRKLG